MRLRQLITTEDSDSATTTAGDIAAVSYPLFVSGTTRRQRRRNSRKAVGQPADNPASYVGKGIYEAEAPEIEALEDSDEDAEAVKESYRILKLAGVEVPEAHTLNSDNVIYRLDPENPMHNTEVLVLGGAGRYTLDGLRQKARKEANALAAELESNHGGGFRGAAHNVKQLTNTLNTIVAAYNELKRIRGKGGRGSRGITDEDANFIRECFSIAEQWTQRYVTEMRQENKS